ncbi:hypothetical protein TREMEDRAFT_58036 [Tremella mesenterica DSM 1558]|uniref:uncharacterized protein n=1 Tax=Tremella mesenterica (strain ATCC 24925 / CBS 8224 / DSM 1558 / NBRC 9311 / NRRL Y-6157 / RJB 2259-6 / UBC 559-6) TaxID=578456 RepID=UPI0003F49287|nr:uncharacterized protein TREMEDRAFT_58036 [Tremella mesenterica DSM 1558]EIW71903.1 hypothetical protein TREMEDRAFT_58036 [Tremella mesenterica DSM 1558]
MARTNAAAAVVLMQASGGRSKRMPCVQQEHESLVKGEETLHATLGTLEAYPARTEATAGGPEEEEEEQEQEQEDDNDGDSGADKANSFNRESVTGVDNQTIMVGSHSALSEINAVPPAPGSNNVNDSEHVSKLDVSLHGASIKPRNTDGGLGNSQTSHLLSDHVPEDKHQASALEVSGSSKEMTEAPSKIENGFHVTFSDRQSDNEGRSLDEEECKPPSLKSRSRGNSGGKSSPIPKRLPDVQCRVANMDAIATGKTAVSHDRESISPLDTPLSSKEHSMDLPVSLEPSVPGNVLLNGHPSAPDGSVQMKYSRLVTAELDTKYELTVGVESTEKCTLKKVKSLPTLPVSSTGVYTPGRDRRRASISHLIPRDRHLPSHDALSDLPAAVDQQSMITSGDDRKEIVFPTLNSKIIDGVEEDNPPDIHAGSEEEPTGDYYGSGFPGIPLSLTEHPRVGDGEAATFVPSYPVPMAPTPYDWRRKAYTGVFEYPQGYHSDPSLYYQQGQPHPRPYPPPGH